MNSKSKDRGGSTSRLSHKSHKNSIAGQGAFNNLGNTEVSIDNLSTLRARDVSEREKKLMDKI
jgi:hypothetical protein